MVFFIQNVGDYQHLLNMLTAGDAQISRVKVSVSETIAVVEVARASGA